MNREPKPKRCKVCRETFSPARPMASVCSPACATSLAMKSKAKREAKAKSEDRKATRLAKERIKTRGEHLREAQSAFNAYARERDFGKPCISCGTAPRQAFGGAVDCGHYRSIGSAPQHRFNLKNCAAQCVKCNRYLGSNSVEMRKGMIEKFGIEAVEALESDQSVRKFDIAYLVRIKQIFRKKTRRLKARRDREYQ